MSSAVDLGTVELWLAILAIATLVQVALLVAGGVVIVRMARQAGDRLSALDPEVRAVLTRASRLLDEAEQGVHELNKVARTTSTRVHQADRAIDLASTATAMAGRTVLARALGVWAFARALARPAARRTDPVVDRTVVTRQAPPAATA